MARNNKDDDGDFIRMQQEAIKRVRDMQARARSTLENDGVAFGDVPPPPPHQKPARPSSDQKPSHPPMQSVWNAPMANIGPPTGSPQNDGAYQNLPGTYREAPLPPNASGHRQSVPLTQKLALALDNEQILLMLLIFMLYRDGSDKFLMLALAYILIS